MAAPWYIRRNFTGRLPGGSIMHPDAEPAAESSPTSRRVFLHQAAGLAAALGASTAAAPAADPPARGEGLLPTVKLGPHQVTRLIIGGNPIYGYSHFNKLLSQHQTDWHTPERVVALLKRGEQAGLTLGNLAGRRNGRPELHDPDHVGERNRHTDARPDASHHRTGGLRDVARRREECGRGSASALPRRSDDGDGRERLRERRPAPGAAVRGTGRRRMIRRADRPEVASH
jgi:hypothetical protein